MLWQFPKNTDPQSFSALASEFLLHAEVELGFSRESTRKYGECLKQIWISVGDKPVTEITKADLLALRSKWLAKNLSASRQTSLLLSLRRFLLFCKDQKHITLSLDPAEIKPPKRPRREVVFLIPEEIEDFIATIPLRTTRGEVHHAGLRLRTVVEVLLGSAMRISEALSLNRSSVDFLIIAKRIRLINAHRELGEFRLWIGLLIEGVNQGLNQSRELAGRFQFAEKHRIDVHKTS